jgi:hypothetical protein
MLFRSAGWNSTMRYLRKSISTIMKKGDRLGYASTLLQQLRELGISKGTPTFSPYHVFGFSPRSLRALLQSMDCSLQFVRYSR